MNSKRGLRVVVGLTLTLGLGLAIALGAGEPGLAAHEDGSNRQPLRWIVGLAVDAGLSAQRVAAADVLEALRAALEAQANEPVDEHIAVEHVFTLIPAAVVRVSPDSPGLIEALQNAPNVQYVVPDGPVFTPERLGPVDTNLNGPDGRTGTGRLVAPQAIPVERYSWGVERIGAPAVHRASPAGITGVAVGAEGTGAPFALVVGLLGLPLGGLVARARVQRPRRPWALVLMLGLGVGLLGLLGCSMAVVLPHPGVLGEGVTVALLDTGVDLKHPDLRRNVVGGVDLVNDDDEPQDDNGHGTGVAGLLAAAENGLGLVGTAPAVKILAVKMLRYDEQGSIVDLIRGIEWAVGRGAQIVSMSLGTEEDNTALRRAIRAAYRAGVLLVAAAGNKGTRVLYPAAYPEVIAVAATDRRDRRAWFSNTGPEVELAAPGVELLTTGLAGGYQTVNGTSFAVPQVAGVAALVMSTGLRDPEAVRQRLRRTADDLGLPLTAQGYGLVDAQRAVLGVERP